MHWPSDGIKDTLCRLLQLWETSHNCRVHLLARWKEISRNFINHLSLDFALEISWRVKYMWYYDKDINGKVRETIYLIISFGIIKRTRYIVSNFGKLRIIVACIYWRDEIGYFKILLIFYWFWMKYCVKSLYLVIISFENLSISNTYKSKTCFSW